MGSVRSTKRNRLYPTGEDHPSWIGGARPNKICQNCGKSFGKKPNQPITTFRVQKFCSKPCADKGGFRYSGENHPNYKEVTRRKDRRGKHGSWARAVVGRDMSTCQKCGATGIELHAHHIREFHSHPALRWELSNGVTLCFRCHWDTHSALTANAVNSVNTPPGQAEGNTEPSFGRKPVEGVTTRGRAYRRYDGSCDYCGTHISKRWSDVAGKAALFCSRSCASKWRVANKITTFGRQ
jgi:5-methylcytosine-specific restriction endonuclease McrA